MARKPEQTKEAVYGDRKRLELIFERAEKNSSRTPEVNQRILELLDELIGIFRTETIQLQRTSSSRDVSKVKRSNGTAKSA